MKSRRQRKTARPTTKGRADAPTTETGRTAKARTQTLQPGNHGVGTDRRTTLPGGLRVVTETQPSVRSATGGIWAGVG
ncbi:insulinase family protein, partial [Streptomyces sp. DT18]